jgi:hypothetical protein
VLVEREKRSKQSYRIPLPFYFVPMMEEIGFEFLEDIIQNNEFKTFCYPYGGFHSFNDLTEKILSENNCQCSFNVEHRDINSNDLINRKQALPRYDCNCFKHGQVRNIN